MKVSRACSAAIAVVLVIAAAAISPVGAYAAGGTQRGSASITITGSQPTDPTPSDPSRPTTPSNPSQPTTPSNPSQPSSPSTPTSPTTPGGSSRPGSSRPDTSGSTSGGSSIRDTDVPRGTATTTPTPETVSILDPEVPLASLGTLPKTGGTYLALLLLLLGTGSVATAAGLARRRDNL